MRDTVLSGKTFNPQSERLPKKATISTFNIGVPKQSVLYRNRETFILLLKVVGELQLRARSNGVIQTIPEFFVLDPSFEGLALSLARGVFEELTDIGITLRNLLESSGLFNEDACEFKSDFDSSKVFPFTAAQMKLFNQAKQVFTA